MIRLTTEQAQQIEEALEGIVRVFKFETGTPVEALATIRAARAQEQAEQEPVAWCSMFGEYAHIEWGSKRTDNAIHTIPLYAAPVRTKDLTKEEIQNAMMPIEPTGKDYFLRLARAVIAADRELNK